MAPSWARVSLVLTLSPHSTLPSLPPSLPPSFLPSFLPFHLVPASTLPLPCLVPSYQPLSGTFTIAYNHPKYAAITFTFCPTCLQDRTLSASPSLATLGHPSVPSFTVMRLPLTAWPRRAVDLICRIDVETSRG